MKLGEDECGVELEQLAGESLTSSSQVCLFHLTNQSPDSWSFSAMCCVAFSSYDMKYPHPQDSESGQKFRKKVKKFRGLSPMGRQAAAHLPLSVECFIVSRGWQIDQAQLNKAISRLEGINFVRIQMVNTINRVIENIRPHNDVVLIHIGPTELSEACHR